jgi:hypothetical protein
MLDLETRRLLNVILAAWTVLWVVVGVVVWHEVRGLRPLATTVGVAGSSLDDTARVVRSFSQVPVVGGSLGSVADDAERTAASAKRSARQGRSSIDRLAVILGIAVPAVAILPVALAFFLLRHLRQ